MAFYGLGRMLPRFARFASRVGRLGRMGRRIPKVFRRRRMMRKKTQNKVHSYVRWCDKDSLYPTTTGPSQIFETGVAQNLVYNFKLDNLVNPSDFTNLYDLYKINKVTLYLERHRNDTDGSLPSNNKLAVVWDDDANQLSNEDQYLEYSNCKRYNSIGNGAIKLVVYPKLSVPILNKDGAVNAFQSIPANKNWIKIEDDEVPHFGLKIFVPPFIGATQTITFTVRAKFHLSLKRAK